MDWAASAAFNSFLDLLTRSLKAFETFGGTDPSSLFKITSEIMLERTKIACLCSVNILKHILKIDVIESFHPYTYNTFPIF